MSPDFGPLDRRNSVAVKVGSVVMGACHPVVVQSMTNTDTADAEATAKQPPSRPLWAQQPIDPSNGACIAPVLKQSSGRGDSQH